MGLKHVGANSVTSVTAYVILYSYIQVHKLVQIESLYIHCLLVGALIQISRNKKWSKKKTSDIYVTYFCQCAGLLGKKYIRRPRSQPVLQNSSSFMYLPKIIGGKLKLCNTI